MMMLWLTGSSRAPVAVAEPPPALLKAGAPAGAGSAAEPAEWPLAVPLTAPAAALGASAELEPLPDELAAPEQAAMSSPAPVRRTAQETAVMRGGIPRPRDEPLALPGRVAPDGWPARRSFGVSMLVGRARLTGGSPARR
jgi:hypothetical protein